MSDWSPASAAFSRLGFDPTGVRSNQLSSGIDYRRSGDPTGVGSMNIGWGGTDPVLDWGVNALNAQLAKDAQQNAGSYFSGQSGNVSIPTTGDWSGVSQWSSDINAAAAKYGIPAGVIAAVMKVESNGDPNSAGAPGVWGPMQVNSNAWGYGAWSEDPHANIDKGAEILRYYYDAAGGDWNRALQLYHGIGFDGNTTESQYADAVMQQWNAIGGSTSTSWAGQGSDSLTSMFGPGSAVQGWGEFGVESDLGYYTYGTQYGMNGTQHTGIDIPVPYGTAYRAPMGGVVTCAGTGVGSGTDGAGCSAFADTIGGGAGRVEVQLDNGVVLIFGHSSASALTPGQRFTAGQVIGWSGGENSDHVHLEARVRDTSTPSGWKIVDPRSVLGGSWSIGSTATQSASTNPITSFLTIPGYSWGR